MAIAYSTADERELLERDRLDCERSLREFALAAWPIVEPAQPYIDNWHIGAICDHLQAVTLSAAPPSLIERKFPGTELPPEIRRLLVNIPPRAMKSLLVSVFWPCWVWTWWPEARFIFSSYAQELSTRDSLKCRNIIRSGWYQEYWGRAFQLVGDQNRKTRFDTDKTGFRLATSVDGMGTGEGGNFIVFDDPHNVTESLSEIPREGVLFWWHEQMSSRLNNPKRDAMVGVMQRVHERDLSGDILERDKYANRWTHLMLPMRFEVDRKCTTPIFEDPRTREGELLWEERIGEKEVQGLEAELRQYGAAGQLQQRPAPRGGGMFKRSWFEVVERRPHAPDARCRYWDMAGTEEREGSPDPDWTAGVLMEVKDDQVYVSDVRRDRLNAAGIEKLIKHTATSDGRDVPIWIEQEPGSSGKAVVNHYMRNVLRGYAVRPDLPTGSKTNRADPIASRAEGGLVKLVGGPWVEEYLRELELFPAGAHDDQVDATSGAYAILTGKKRVGVIGRRRAG